MNLSHYCLIFFLCLVNALPAFSQEIEIKVKGHVERYGHKLEGVSVKLSRDGKEEKNVITKANGKYQFMLIEPNSKYVLEFRKADHVPIKIVISTEIPPKSDFIEREFTIPVGIIERFPGLDVSFMEHPIAIIKYDPQIQNFNYDEKHFLEVKNKLLSAQSRAQGMHEKGIKPILDDATVVAKTDNTGKEAEKKVREDAEAKLKEDALKKKREEELKAQRKVENIKLGEDAERKAREMADKGLEDRRDNTTVQQAAKGNKNAPEEARQEQKNPEMESDAAKTAREKAEREAEIKKNKGIKAAYENEVLKTVAENERRSKELDFVKQRSEADASMLVRRYKEEDELKIFYAPLLWDKKEQLRLAENNRAIKNLHVSSLSETVAREEKAQKRNTPGREEREIIVFLSEELEEGFWSKTKITKARIDSRVVVLKKETMLWGTETYYLNDQSIKESEYFMAWNKIKKR